MSIWRLLCIAIFSGAIFWGARQALFRTKDLMDFAVEEKDPTQSLRLSSLGCLGAIVVFPVIVVSGLFFLLSVTAILMGDWQSP